VNFNTNYEGAPPTEQVDREDRLAKIYAHFVKQRDEWVQHRQSSGIENKWAKWEKLYDGSHEEEQEANAFINVLKHGPSKRTGHDSNRSTVVVNIVRPKVDQQVARLCEVLLPTDDKNWGIKPTPKPDLAEIAQDQKSNIVDIHTGEPQAAVAQQIIDAAKKSAEGMILAIDDALTECNYNGECREVITSGVKLGTGVIKGPFPQIKRNRTWNISPTGSELQITESVVPVSQWRSVWNIYPDKSCGNDIHRGLGVYEKSMVNRKELRDLIGVPGYFEDAIRKVLAQDPCRVSAAPDTRGLARTPSRDGMYEMWEYNGEIDEDQIYELTADQETPLRTKTGMLVIVNDVIIGALESSNTDKPIPYDFWCFREKEDSPWGDGQPEELEHQQRVVKSAWRQLMDNAAAAAGFHIVIKKGLIVPAGARQGDYTLTSRMVWEANEEVDDVRNAFTVNTIDMRAQELLLIIDAAMKFADQEASSPQLLGGEKGTAPETVGGMQILQSNAQGPLRFRVKRFDDKITKPQIGAHYDWQMEYNPDPSIKGDFEVDARGSTYLLERDIQAQSMINALAITQDPRFMPHFDDRRLLEDLLRALRFPDGSLKPAEQAQADIEAAAQQGAPQDPRIVSAQMALEGKQLDIQDRKEQRAADMELADKELQVKRESIAYNIERERAEGEQGLIQAQLDRELTIAKMETDGLESAEERMSRERLKAMELDSKHSLFNAEAALAVRTGSGI
jgi:hypothetical protein